MLDRLSDPTRLASFLMPVVIGAELLACLVFVIAGVLRRRWRVAFATLGAALALPALPFLIGAAVEGEPINAVLPYAVILWGQLLRLAVPALACLSVMAWVLRDLHRTAGKVIEQGVRRRGVRGGVLAVVLLLTMAAVALSVAHIAAVSQ